jgi:hypothetical protein
MATKSRLDVNRSGNDFVQLLRAGVMRTMNDLNKKLTRKMWLILLIWTTILLVIGKIVIGSLAYVSIAGSLEILGEAASLIAISWGIIWVADRFNPSSSPSHRLRRIAATVFILNIISVFGQI